MIDAMRQLAISPTPSREATAPAAHEDQERSAAADQSAFLHSVAYELSTPLTPIVGYLQLLLSGKLGPLTDQQARVLEAMGQSSERLARIIENLVDLADLEAGSNELQRKELDPVALLNRCLDEARSACRSKRVEVERILGSASPILGDEDKLRQAFQNLMENALKVSPHGGVVLAELKQSRPSELEISLYDQGCGMDESLLDTLSRPFSHATAALAARRPGAGLGLPVARRIVEAHGGELHAESPPETQPLALHHFCGTRVWLTLPTVNRPAQP
jgi:signal transduction histidine kinase